MIDNEAGAQVREENGKEKKEEDLEEKVIHMNNDDGILRSDNHNEHREGILLSKFQTLNPTNPLRIVINSNNMNRVSNPSPAQPQRPPQPRSVPFPIPQQVRPVSYIQASSRNMFIT